ncbi:MAG: exodeoxyribonuclease VII large subunit [Oscillospiraceae bacterium]|nr:exodeoxyribonuclease VII large subunit [Oscillospiraceae bacterium]
MDETKVFSVSELNGLIKELFDESRLFQNISVRGELSNYKVYPSGHHYFTLKDSESSLRCVMFKNNALRLRFRPESGMSVTAFGRISVFPRDGAYQLYCTGLMPEGAGDLQVAFEQLKKKLSAEGLFDEEHKKPLPAYPKKIAIVTSSAGAAIHDMIRILSHRWPMTKVLLLPVRVQGEEAPAEIAGAIRYANRHRLADLLITGRGGGSIEDLWAFNDERVARAIFESEIPVISAVGHEPDVTISDYVADRRASTPSNAAEIAVPDSAEEREGLSSLAIRASQTMDKRLRQLRTELDNLSTRRVLRDAGAYLDDRRVELDHLRDKLLSAMESELGRKKQREVRLAAALDAMSPLRVLTRGYALASDEQGRIVSSVRMIRSGSKLRLKLSDGSASCVVESTREVKTI